jgi:GNAT superfamily N-acetyltransferase
MSGENGRRIAIRRAHAGDIPLILQLIRELAEYERLLGDVEATEESLGRTLFPGAGAPPAAQVVIGELDGVPEGFAVYFFNYSTFLARPGLYLEDLFVRPAARGKGLGKALLLHLAGLAAERGCGRMEWSVLDWNTPSIEFYKGIGAVPLGDWTTFRLAGEALRRRGPRG